MNDFVLVLPGIIQTASITKEAVFKLTVSLIHHTLYMRCFIPQPYTRLLDQIATKESSDNDIGLLNKRGISQRLKLAREAKKVNRFFDSMEEILNAFSVIVEHFSERVDSVQIMLGPSINNPKEIYSISFDSGWGISHFSDTESLGNVDSIERTMKRLQRWIIQRMIEFDSIHGINQKPNRSWSFFLAVKVRVDLIQSGSFLDAKENVESNCGSIPGINLDTSFGECYPAQLLRLFSIKETMKTHLKPKKIQRELQVQPQFHAVIKSGYPYELKDPQYRWFVMKRGIKGCI